MLVTYLQRMVQRRPNSNTVYDMSASPLSEYHLRYLHRELLLRMAMQNAGLIVLAIAFLTVVSLAAIIPHKAHILNLGFTATSGMLSLFWNHSRYRTVQIKTYLKRLEQQEPGWESWLVNNPFTGVLGSQWFMSTIGVFVGSQLIAAMLCWMVAEGSAQIWIFGLSLLATAVNAVVLFRKPAL